MITLEIAPTALLGSMGILMVSLMTILVHDSEEEKRPIERPNLIKQAPRDPLPVQKTRYQNTPATTVVNNTWRFYPPLEYVPNKSEQTVPSPRAPKLILHDELVNSTHNLATSHPPEHEIDPSPTLWPDTIYYAPAPREGAKGVQPQTHSNANFLNNRAYRKESKGIEVYIPSRQPSAYRPRVGTPSASTSSQHLYAPPSTSRHRYPSTPQAMPHYAQRGYANRTDLGNYQAYTPPRPSAPSRFHPGLPYHGSR